MHPDVSTELDRTTRAGEPSPWERIPALPLPVHAPGADVIPNSQIQHKQVVDPAWFQWPCALLAQGLLLQQQGWQCASTAMETLRLNLPRCENTSARSLDSERERGDAQ